MPQDYLRDLDDPEKANALIRDAATPSTAQMSRAYAASTIYLAYQTKAAGEKLAGSVTSLTRVSKTHSPITEKLFETTAKSAETCARWLNYAIWALVFVTLVLAVVEAVTIYKGCP